MNATVVLRLPDGSTAELHPGDFIGRLWTAALQVDDARVSEAHALVSLRGGELKLLALRGLFAVDGTPVREAVLQQGQIVALARGLELVVEAVVLPDQVLALEGPGLTRQVLSGTCSVYGRPSPRIVGGYQPDAAATFWHTGAGWRCAVGGAAPIPVAPGDAVVVDGLTLSAVAVALARAEAQATRVRGAIASPLRLVAQFDTVQLHREGEPPVLIGGIGARILSELVALDGPAPWETVAREVWGDDGDRRQLRRKWDVALARLRTRLREVGIRDDLVSADRSGSVELLLLAQDTVEDRT